MALLLCLPARAEEKQLQPIAATQDAVAVEAPVATSAPRPGKNLALQDTLQLQNQIQTLKRLIAHEQSVSAMVQAAVAIGLNDPVLPRPDKDLCTQVPGNISCASVWPALYKDFDLHPGNAKYNKKIAATPPDINTMPRAIKDMPAEAQPLLPVPEPVVAAAASLYWMDITCVQEKCSAVISPEPNNPNARYRITPGETLPDGATVSAISAAGVTLHRNDSDIRLEPAPQA